MTAYIAIYLWALGAIDVYFSIRPELRNNYVILISMFWFILAPWGLYLQWKEENATT